jgi:hypothetical protein
MPVNNPMVGETWEMTDPVSGQPAQAVVISLTDTAVRLMSRQKRTLNFPLRSFHLTWRFLREAPVQSCAYAGCTEQGYIQVNTLGSWVWVCHTHLPIHARPLLPVDNNFNAWSSSGASPENCPSCSTPIGSEGYSYRELSGHTVHRCGSCNVVWVQGVLPESEYPGLDGGEVVQDLAIILEQEGFRARALVGQEIWVSMLSLLGPVGDTGVAGVEIRMHTGDPRSIILLGDRPGPRTGIRRLGGQPDRPTATIPEIGSLWQDSQSGKVMLVNEVRFATLTGQAGRQIRIEGTLTENKAPVEVWLEDFVKSYVPHRTSPSPLEDRTAPCSIGEVWEDSRGQQVDITEVNADFVEGRLSTGGLIIVQMATFRSKYKKVPPRKSALDRILDED